MPTMVEIDCAKYKDRCKELEEVFLNGLSSQKLQQMGIQAGSARAKELENTLNDIYVHCCTQMRPGRPPQEVVTSGTYPLPLVRPGSTSIWSRLGLWVTVILAAAAIAEAARFRFCRLIRTRTLPSGAVQCTYDCAGSRTTFTNPVGFCPPGYWTLG
jgi:hypothetical protein